MRKLAISILLMILSASVLNSDPMMYLRVAAEGSYLTNAFSDPLPVNASESYLEDIEFIKRWNVSPSISFDTFFDDSNPAGLSFNSVFRFPVSSETIVHDGSSYVSHDSLSEQKIGIYHFAFRCLERCCFRTHWSFCFWIWQEYALLPVRLFQVRVIPAAARRYKMPVAL